MKSQRITIFLSLVFLLVSCEFSEATEAPEHVQADPQIAVPASTPTIPVNTPTETLAPIPVPPNSTVVEFLVDKSGSVDNNCGEAGKKRLMFVEYMVRLLKNNAISSREENGAKLYVGVAQYGADFNPNQIPINIEDLAEEDIAYTFDQNGTEDTQYATRIVDAIAEIKGTNAQKKILVILTDGEFESDSIAEIYEAVTSNVGDNINIYIALLCPQQLQSSTQSWFTYFGNVNGVHVLRSAEEAGAEVLEQLKTDGFLPDGFTSLHVSNSNIDVDIPGYSNTAIFSFWSTSEQLLHINVNDTPFITVLSDKPELKPVDPKPFCGDIKFQVQALALQENGLLFVTYDTFEDMNLSVNLISQSAVINNMPVKIKVTANDLGTVGKFGNWRDCFDIKLDTLDLPDNLFNQEFCDDNLYKCFSDGTNSFYSIWEWTPPSRDDLQSIVIQARLIASNNENMEFVSTIEKIPVTFRANYIESVLLPDEPNASYPTESLVAKLQRKIIFEFVAKDPRIRLFSSKQSVDELNTLDLGSIAHIPFVGCPFATEVNGRLAKDLTDHSYLCDENNDLQNVLARTCVDENTASPLRPVTYIFETYSYVVSKCSFNQLQFIWDDLDGVLANTLSCSITQDSITCQ